MKQSDLFRKYARMIDMCEGTAVKPWWCVKMDGLQFNDECGKPKFDDNPDAYTFAIAIVEGKPVFKGDELYAYNRKLIAHSCYNTQKIYLSGGRVLADITMLSWNPPKPSTVLVELLLEDAKRVRHCLDLYEVPIAIERSKEAFDKALEASK